MARIAPDRAYSGRSAKLFEGAPSFVLPPALMYKVFVTGSSWRPFTEWFSSERERPRTRSSFCQEVPLQVRREIVPEFVSRPVSCPDEPAPMRGSLELM